MRQPRVAVAVVSLVILVAGASRADLLQTAKAGDVPKVKRLPASGANPNTRNQNGWTVLHVAAGAGEVEVARLLLASRADPNLSAKMRAMPLHAAVHGGSVAVTTSSIILPPHGGGAKGYMILKQNQKVMKGDVTSPLSLTPPLCSASARWLSGFWACDPDVLCSSFDAA